jgi:hypothetical protein
MQKFIRFLQKCNTDACHILQERNITSLFDFRPDARSNASTYLSSRTGSLLRDNSLLEGLGAM